MIRCSVCHRWFDPADLVQVMYHKVHRPVLVPSDLEKGVQVGPCRVCRRAKECEKVLGAKFDKWGVCQLSPKQFQAKGVTDG